MKQESGDYTHANSYENKLILILKLVHLICIGKNGCNVFGKSISLLLLV